MHLGFWAISNPTVGLDSKTDWLMSVLSLIFYGNCRAYVVRQAAAIAYGALGGVAAGVSTASNGRPGSGSSAAATDRFMAWALSQITDATRGNEATVLALGGLREFFTAG